MQATFTLKISTDILKKQSIAITKKLEIFNVFFYLAYLYEMIAIGFLNNAQFHLNQGMHGFYCYFTKAQRLQRKSLREIVIESDKNTYCSFLGILLIAHRNLTDLNINESDGKFLLSGLFLQSKVLQTKKI